MKKLLYISLCLLLACKPQDKNQKFTVVTTTTMITDLVKQIGKDKIKVEGLMGAGVDPHLYKASEGDVNKLYNADVIVYNGLHLEGKLAEVFEQIEVRGKNTIAIGDYLTKSQIIQSKDFASNYDPHIWFAIENWKTIALALASELGDLDPENKDFYQKNGKIYIEKLQRLQQIVNNKIIELPVENRILVTAHDAFSYFGKEHQFKVVSIQGISTVAEAGVKDVQRIAAYIVKHKVKAVFVESSVPKKTIEALQAAVKAKRYQVKIGGELYSDALGASYTAQGSYIGMYTYNVNTIVKALK